MVTREDLESYLIRMDLESEEIAEGMYLVRSREEALPLVVHHSPPLLLVRLKVMDLPPGEGPREALYRTLLELNASDLVHGAYALEGNEIVLGHTLQLESLGYPELQAVIEGISMAAAGHMDRIRTLAAAPVEG